MALAVELEIDPVVDDALAIHPLADAGVAQQLDGALLEHAGADAVLDVVAAAASSTTLSMPATSSSRASVSPAGPAPTMPTCVLTRRGACSSAALNSSGRSTFARCAARSSTTTLARGISAASVSSSPAASSGPPHRRSRASALRSRRAPAQVEVAQELAVADVRLGREREEHLAKAFHVGEARREPARQHLVGDRGHPAGANQRDARVPGIGRGKAAAVHASTSRSIRSGASSAICIPTAPPSDKPTNEKRSACTRVENVAREVADVVQLDHRRAAVTRMLDAHDLEVAERSRLRIPHRRRRGEGAAEHDGGQRYVPR